MLGLSLHRSPQRSPSFDLVVPLAILELTLAWQDEVGREPLRPPPPLAVPVLGLVLARARDRGRGRAGRRRERGREARRGGRLAELDGLAPAAGLGAAPPPARGGGRFGARGGLLACVGRVGVAHRGWVEWLGGYGEEG